MTNITPEIDQAIKNRINAVYFKVGFLGFALIVVFAVSFYFAIKIGLSRADVQYRTDLEKDKIKSVEIWNQQKDLMFEFVTFLEEKVFNNENLNQNLTSLQIQEEHKKISKELNTYYGKLYLVMETPILEKINELINNDISNVQRYYLYKELRKQLMGIFYEDIKESNFPYIAGEANGLIFIEENNNTVQRKAKNLQELIEHYPFVEEHDTAKGKIKTLPFYGTKE